MADKPDWAEDFVRRVMRWEFSGEYEDTRASDVRKLFAAELRARVGASPDDWEKITSKWARSVGVMWVRWKYDDINGRDVVAFIDKPNGDTLEIKTRGELRRLCAALGIALPAAPKGESQ